MNDWDRKIDPKLAWCLVGTVLRKPFIQKKKNEVKNKKKCRMFMHVLVKKMLIIKFNALIIEKVLLDERGQR